MGQTASSTTTTALEESRLTTTSPDEKSSTDDRNEEKRSQSTISKPETSLSKRRSSATSVSVSNHPPLPPVVLASSSEWKQTLGRLSDVELQEVILSAPVSEKDIKTMAARIHQYVSVHNSNDDDEEKLPNHDKPFPPISSSEETVQKHGVCSSIGSSSSTTTETHFYVTSASQLSSKRSTRSNDSSGDEDENDDDDLTALCFRILRISPTMAKLRFRLVPTKIKEHLFWQALWTILYETLKQTQVESQATEAQAGVDNHNDIRERREVAATTMFAKRSFLSNTFSMVSNVVAPVVDNEDPSSNADTTDKEFAEFQKERVQETIFQLHRTIEKQEWKLQEMQQEIHRLQNLQQLQEQHQSTQTPIHSKTQKSPKHKGKWIMDQDSKDFLEYPLELKENLRMEKQKRLKEVKSQMKFILDSDRVEDSNGQWECCGQTEYMVECTTSKQ